MPLLSVRAVSRRFAAVAALDAVSFDVAAGDVTCLVGESGCGKSTLLRIIAGVDQADDGEVWLGGQRVAGEGLFVEPQDRQVGFMFQDYALFPHLTARANIGFGLRGMPRRDADARVAAIVERLGLQRLADRYPHELSGGEQQRIALARALAPQPRVLLMDEPFSNLDRGLRDVIRRETVGVLRALGTTAIIVTHDPEEALALGDRIVLMRHGRIVENGTGDALFTRPGSAYAAGFFSAVNSVSTTSDGAGIDTAFGRIAAPGVTGPVQVLVRPQAVVLVDGGVPARVRDRVLLGEIEELTLDVDGLAAPIILRTSARSGAVVGDVVHVAVAAEDFMVFPHAPAET